MTHDELRKETAPGDDGLGCQAFGHLVSPFIDRELPAAETERFETHLPGCPPCRRLHLQYRAIELAAQGPLGQPAEQDWQAAWSAVRTAIAEDRRKAAESPLAPVLKALERFWPRSPRSPRLLRPLAYLAASLLLVLTLFAVQRSAERPGDASLLAEKPGESTGIDCAPGYVAVAYTIPNEDELVSVQYCAFVGADPTNRG